MALEKQATGGTITLVNDEVVHTFTSSGTFVCPSNGTVEYLVVGGGGDGAAGGTSMNYQGGAGGRGGLVLSGVVSLNPILYAITIGNSAQDSSIGTILTATAAAEPTGSGGTGGTGDSGGPLTSPTPGGAGKSNSISGSVIFYGKGGNGGASLGFPGYGTAGAAGLANRGNGGGGGVGGGMSGGAGGAGGSGIVIIRYKIARKTRKIILPTYCIPMVMSGGGYQ